MIQAVNGGYSYIFFWKYVFEYDNLMYGLYIVITKLDKVIASRIFLIECIYTLSLFLD